MDKRSEFYLLGEIKRDFPDHSIVTEESGFFNGSEDQRWFIDPLDGTSNYAHGVPIFSVTIAYAQHGQLTLAVTIDPTRAHCFSAERGQGAYLNTSRLHVSKTQELVDAMLVTGFPPDKENPLGSNLENFSNLMGHAQSIRRLGSAALDLAYVAAGWLDGYWEMGIHAWDIAAGSLLVKEAGGAVTDLKGNADYFKPPYAMVAANPVLHAKLLSVLRSDQR
jgi:myo-inositol-1(or 4)-monophosphatase